MAEYVTQTIEETGVVPQGMRDLAGVVLAEAWEKLQPKLGFWQAYGWVADPPQVIQWHDPLTFATEVTVRVRLSRRVDV